MEGQNLNLGCRDRKIHFFEKKSATSFFIRWNHTQNGERYQIPKSPLINHPLHGEGSER